jgi:high-affinity iron transporter
MTRRHGLAFALVALFALTLVGGAARASASAAPAATPAAAAGSGTKAEALRQLMAVRASIDETLSLSKEGRADEAFAKAKDGYLSHFELVEVPLRVADARLTADAETKFAEIRGLISSGAPVSEVRANVVELRRLIDSAERRLTDAGLGAPTVVAGQSFIIIFREGLEAVLLISVLLGYLEKAKATQYRRPILWGMAGGVVASALTFLLLRSVLAALPFGREVLEAATAILAVVVLFYVSFWLIARLEQKRWLEFLRTRIWTAVSVGSTAALVGIGFTAIYREGFETALFYQALLSFGEGLGLAVAVGLLLGVAALAAAAWVIFKMGRRLPIKALLGSAVVVLMATSVAFIGNAVRSLQQADVLRLTPLKGWPQMPIFLAQSLGYWPSVQTVLAQAVLAAVYVAGALYVFVIRPRRAGAGSVRPAPAATPSAPASPGETSATAITTSTSTSTPTATATAPEPEPAPVRPT